MQKYCVLFHFILFKIIKKNYKYKLKRLDNVFIFAKFATHKENCCPSLPIYPKAMAKMLDSTSLRWSLVMASTEGVLTLLQIRNRTIFVTTMRKRLQFH